MFITKRVEFPTIGNTPVVYDEPSICPLCKHAIKPVQLSLIPFQDESEKSFFCLTYLCKSCYQTFLALYEKSNTKDASHNSTYKAELLYEGPQKFEPEAFDQSIETISPQFVKIYNQALSAEASGLDEIAGIGFRKALEFLIKDYLIHETPDDAEVIKKMELANCIANKVSNTKLQTVASRSAWLGNDQTHYVQRYADRDIDDMKNFIKATVYWISMELITEDALGIRRADRP